MRDMVRKTSHPPDRGFIALLTSFMPIDKAQLYASVLTSFMSTTLASSASCMLVVASSVISIGSLLDNLGSSCIHPVPVVLSPDRV